MSVLRFIAQYYNLQVFILFLIASFFLIVIDSKGYERMNLKRESKFSKIAGYIYLFISILLLIMRRYINS